MQSDLEKFFNVGAELLREILEQLGPTAFVVLGLALVAGIALGLFVWRRLG
jgi:hypothetical protein